MSARLGRFALQRVLWQSAQATVWLAQDPRLQRLVAIQLLPAVVGAGAAMLEPWLRSARQLVPLVHPHMVPVLEADVQGLQPYLVLEYVPGTTLLAEYLAQRGRCAPHDAVALVVDVLDGLQAAHAAGAVHGHLTLAQVVVDAQRNARVMGFALGAAGAGTGPAPETGAALAQAFDTYGAAQLLVELLTGQPLCGPAGAALVLPGDLGPGADDALRAILLRALAPEPSARFATAAQLRDALRDWAAPSGAASAQSNATLDFLLRRMRHQSDFPALSDSVVRIQRVASSEDDSISDLTHEILKDVALTHKLLRLVNSVHFAHASRGSVSTVSRAVSLVGFNAVRTMALSLVLLAHMQNQQHASQMREEFLRAMMAGSVAAELSGPGTQSEEAFIGAMFQSLGRMLCEFYFPEEAGRIRAIVAAGRTEGGEEAAAQQVLGVGLEDLGAGVARVWGLPETLQRCMRKPLGAPPLRAPEKGVERLRWVARAANEVARALMQADARQVQARLQALATQYARTLGLSAEAIAEATLRARHQLVAMAQALDLQVEPGSPAARLLQSPAPATADGAAPDDPLAAHELHLHAAPPLSDGVPPAPGRPDSMAEVAEVLSAGVQDITNAMVDEGFKLNDVLRMILETMFRALGAQRMVFCLRDAKSDVLTGRFGLGEDNDVAVRAMAVPLKTPGDLFAAVCLRGADTLIADATEPRMQARLPGWYRSSLDAPTFLLLPLQIKGRPFALIYADQARPGAFAVDDKVLGLLRTLRNQAVMAFRQAG